MRSWIDFTESRPFTALLIGAVALPTIWEMHNDWHAVAMSLFLVAGYWFIFRVRS
jgi:hypothetical protein